MPEAGVIDFNVAETSGFSRRILHACGKAGVRATHGSFAAAYFPAMREQVSLALSDPHLFSSRSVPVMAFAQLTYRESLRDIETCLRAHSAKLYHLGIRGGIARSTPARVKLALHTSTDF